jgi:hypothetical protein
MRFLGVDLFDKATWSSVRLLLERGEAKSMARILCDFDNNVELCTEKRRREAERMDGFYRH